MDTHTLHKETELLETRSSRRRCSNLYFPVASLEIATNNFFLRTFLLL